MQKREGEERGIWGEGGGGDERRKEQDEECKMRVGEGRGPQAQLDEGEGGWGEGGWGGGEKIERSNRFAKLRTNHQINFEFSQKFRPGNLSAINFDSEQIRTKIFNHAFSCVEVDECKISVNRKEVS